MNTCRVGAARRIGTRRNAAVLPMARAITVGGEAYALAARAMAWIGSRLSPAPSLPSPGRVCH